MNVTVKVDETNDNKMTDYKVKSLKSNELGMNNTVIDEIERLDVYIGIDEIKSQLDTIESESSSKIQKVNNAYRSFKPIFGHCVDWSSVGGNNTWEDERIKTEIDSLVSYGVEKLSITIQTRCVDGTVSLISDLERFKKCLDYANEKGLETTTIKVHCNQFRKAIESNEYDNANLKQQWLNILNDIGDYFKSYCEYFVVINEGENLFSDSSHEEFLLKCLDVGKNKGFKSGFTPSSSGGGTIFLNQ
ncbi:MAG TPA: hypothetical protein DCE23_01895 [Firmicutes bacterium]|nr:hypothetical protein [Bacillota bacterium]